ncbi:MAG: hypothetical protein JWN70_4127 [Planctomycetaceae bacterium]|nr:hypothetical protein [Planctomycetaceae bacterium]
MPAFFQVAFALAGLAAATGPVIIHLLNRRRFRVVEWAAMDFLREALQRNRKMLQLRDLILLALRTAVVLLFGLALARPYWQHQAGMLGGRGAVHAVLILDNSQSMGFAKLDGTLLDEAKRKAEEFIGQLPTGSRISIVPLCGSDAAFSLEPYRSPEDAREALAKLKVVDRSGTAGQAADLAVEACQLAPDLPAKRVVFLGDQQTANWPTGGLADQLKKLPEMQVVHIGADTVENAWVADFRLQDGIADIETPTAFYATIRYDGPAPKSNVQVSLEVDGSSVASRTIDLEPGQSREIQFPYRFDVPVEPGRASFITASVKLHEDTLPGDRLVSDNQRFAVVPVVAALPVVFIDQLGEKEDPARGDYGESFHLRRLLAPVISRGDTQRQLVQIRHTTIANVNRQMLEDARLVVISGVANPGAAVSLLREYVQQGGQIVITAGAQFDPQAWNDTAWLDGAGILPAPLQTELFGKTPEESAGQLAPFQLAVNSLVHDYFRLEDVSEEELADLYQTPLFFKSAVVDASPAALEAFSKAETTRLTEEREFFAESTKRQAAWARQEAQGTLDAASQQQKRADDQRRAELQPKWLLWTNLKNDAATSTKPIAQLVEAAMPQVLGHFTDANKLPFLVERRIGSGQVLFYSSSTFSEWNDLTKTNAALVFDRIFRFMLQDTLPRRNLEAVEQVTLPVESGDRRVTYTLTRPGQPAETLNVDALGGETYGVTIRNITKSGHYLVSAVQSVDPAAAQSAEPDKLWSVPLAVNGPERESELRSIDAAELRKRLGNANYRWIERDEQISLEGAQISLQNLWKWLIWLVLVGLLVELVMLAWPNLKQPNLQKGVKS